MEVKMKSRKNQLGFTLIEIMVALAVLTILLAIAVPSFQAMTKNSQILNAAESVSNGLAKARAEAINRNTNVAFALGAGTSWSITQVSDGTVIDSRASKEGSANVTLTAVDSAGAAVTTVTFNSLGSLVGISPVAKVDFTATGADRNLRVTIGVGGKTQVCDPNLTTGSSPRAC